MSEWEAQIGAIEAAVRVAVPTLPAGSAGFSRDDRNLEELSITQIPHCAVVDEAEGVTDFEYEQESRETQFGLEYWTAGSREEAATDVEAIRDQLLVDPTLGGLVESTFVSARDLEEAIATGRQRRRAQLVVVTRRVY